MISSDNDLPLLVHPRRPIFFLQKERNENGLTFDLNLLEIDWLVETHRWDTARLFPLRIYDQLPGECGGNDGERAE